MKKLLTVLLALAMAFTMVFATAASAEDGYKDSITWVIGNDQDILDPQNNVSNSKVMPQYYDGLLGYDNDGNVVCKMAESYEASEDKMTWTFHLRQDVYFHSGRHCTAHDFEATFDRLLNTENPQRYTSIASFIDTAVATDDYTFVITLKEPKAFFLQAIAKHWAFVLNPEYIEKYGADLGKTAESVDGTGPFKCTQWDKGEVMKFEAFENYYEGAPLTHEIVMKIVPEQTSRAIAVETNQADIADGVSPDDAVRLDALDGVTHSRGVHDAHDEGIHAGGLGQRLHQDGALQGRPRMEDCYEAHLPQRAADCHHRRRAGLHQRAGGRGGCRAPVQHSRHGLADGGFHREARLSGDSGNYAADCHAQRVHQPDYRPDLRLG